MGDRARFDIRIINGEDHTHTLMDLAKVSATLDSGSVIEGLLEGMMSEGGMCVGEVRTIISPMTKGYGEFAPNFVSTMQPFLGDENTKTIGREVGLLWMEVSAQHELQENGCNSLGMQAICDWASVLEPH